MGARRITVQPRKGTGFARERGVLLARIADLEVRLQLLEARVRRDAAQGRQAAGTAGPGARKAGKAKAAPVGRRRPRCPGCLLELPKGRRGEMCVWCGFQFDAVGGTFR